MSGGAEHGKKAEQDKKPADPKPAGGHGEKAKGPGFFRKALDLAKGLATPITWIAGQTWRRVKGVGGGAWGATVGQVPGEAREIAHRVGHETLESDGPLSAITGLTRVVGDEIGKVLGGVVSYGASLPTRALDRAVHGVEHAVWGGLVKGRPYAGRKGREATRHDEESAAHDASAHGAH